MNITKNKFIEIIITALISAGIAFLQNLLAQHTGTGIIETNPETAGIIGGAISAVRKATC